MNYLTLTSWILMTSGLIGAYFNVKKKRICFLIWGIGNLGWIIYDFIIEEYAQSIMFLVFFGISVWGLIKWKKEKTEY